ncbi:NAD(P)/FAD-dependent oxidoreductase [Corynebacterium guangdongense]|uniref:NADPH-dependent 2,4-dienoyl-CoA reductase/sulfur reductase-like enzyme n=1 Tax=Corynebacterium guangdongense TaxID=1783348 RepID=A0ABU1ZUG6_9CORY|nr:FAD-dependent oxidoreductase [Corynebacterium guangdongense]MDR7328569.1 NADPH-dependent 2,4-dienoyl-CoA reductase/sulfur reductase-like enzyme [Corynebacterium guangdongense]WJZ17146.1 Benzene 1,2-dioxygenase system ferredoxin--NAD(+) reductase subunit [Corynebacterium guangdongense]
MAYDNIVIAGHGVAGLTAGDTLRRLGYQGRLTVIGEETHTTYSRPALSKAALAPGAEMDVNFLPEPTHGADALLGHTATGLDVANSTLTTSDGAVILYDGLVIATGAQARRFTDSPNELTLRSLDDAVRLKGRLTETSKVTVIGGGPLGMEVASGALNLGCETTLIHAGVPMSAHIGPFLSARLSEAAREAGLIIVDGFVSGVEETAAGMLATLADGRTFTSEIIITAAGDIPNDSWLADSGLLVDGRLVTDTRCRVHENIVACGDVAWIGGAGGPRRTPIWTAAVEQGKAAATALLRGDEAPELDFQNYFWTDQWGVNVKISGPIPRGLEPEIVKGSLTDRSFVAYWPEENAAAAYNMRTPIPKLHTIARGGATVPAS